MRLFVDYIAAKLVIAPALNGLAGGTGALYAQSGTVLQGAIDGLVAAAVASGDISTDIEPVDLLRALAGYRTTPPVPAGRPVRSVWSIFSSPDHGHRHHNQAAVFWRAERPSRCVTDIVLRPFLAGTFRLL